MKISICYMAIENLMQSTFLSSIVNFELYLIIIFFVLYIVDSILYVHNHIFRPPTQFLLWQV